MARVLVILASALVLAACGTAPTSKKVEAQSWSGNYRFQWMKDTQAARRGMPAPKQVQIRPLTVVKDVPGAKTDYDGPQWAISFVGEPGKPLPLAPFGTRDYEGMNLVKQRAAGEIHCLQSGAFLFLCRTAPGAIIQLGSDVQDQLTTKTGLFGVVLHQGGFELTPLD
ncbi:MAG: hypothetical protein RSF42_08705 [Comamonas sp.]